jgi:thiamine-monophosphate kinase
MRSEFELIQNIKKKYGLNRIGDDCAVLAKDADTDLLLTADLLIEDIDFRLDWTSAEFLGRKAAAVSLSDIAAMGGVPDWCMVSLGVPEKLWVGNFVDRLYEGLHAFISAYGTELIGGDISRSPDRLVIDSIVIGHCSKNAAITRSGASPGDAIFVTGALGEAAAGLRLLEQGIRAESASGSELELIMRQLSPTPRIDAAQRVIGIATSMIDISDGLSSDLAHLCEASRVGARITDVPIAERLFECFDHSTAAAFALNGGEDFELLFTANVDAVSRLGLPDLIRIGEITSNTGAVEVVIDGEVRPLASGGFRHF